MRRRLLCLALASPLVVVGPGWLARRTVVASAEPAPVDKPAAAPNGWTTAVEPKPLAPPVLKGLAWLAEHQLPGGGWGQGEESAQMGGAGSLKDIPNVADTCIAALAMIRSGSTPRSGPYRDAIAKAVRFVRAEVEGSDSRSLAVSRVTGTRVQMKLGPNIDTFLASMLLAEVKGRMPDDAANKGVDTALAAVLGKIQAHQKADGSFEGAGWAPVLAQAMCGKGINRAKQAGAQVADVVLARAEDGAKIAMIAPVAAPAVVSTAEPGVANVTPRPGAPFTQTSASAATSRGGRTAGMAGMMSAPRGDAGVALYGAAADLGVLQDSVNTGRAQARDLKEQAANAPTAPARAEAKVKLDKLADLEKTQDGARAAVVAKLEDKGFVAGFGSNGGEEFLSYMNIAETLVVKGGDEWTKWDAKMAENLGRVQNGDGSWSGHHCITGRTFCTSTALLVLMADRTPIPASARPAAGARVEPEAKADAKPGDR